tara:strand:+ start:1001 stop:1192 length:192 start_codon:yes stop_codon:yes gene_type:complete
MYYFPSTVEEKKPMPKIDPDEQDDYPMELMGEHPPIENLLAFNEKDSTLRVVNSEDFCTDTEE